jgi:peroxiredoxin
MKSLAQPAESIPDFTLFRADSTEFTKKDLDSEKLLFFLFFDVKCIHCKHATQIINKNYHEMINTSIYLVTLDKPEEVNSFLKQNGKKLIEQKNVHLLFDTQNQFITRFKPKKFPSIFLYNSNQKLLAYKDDPDSLQLVFDQIKAFSKN